MTGVTRNRAIRSSREPCLSVVDNRGYLEAVR